MRALILVDLQNDFMPGGPLAVPEGDAVVPIASQLLPRFDCVVATQDWHPPDHGSFASRHPGRKVGDVIRLNGLDQVLWPDHCVQHTAGAALVDGLNATAVHRVVRKGTDPGIDSYSGFFDNDRRRSTGLDVYLHERGVDVVYVMGVATDYCVKFTALDAVAAGFRTCLVRPGVRGVDLHPGDCARAIEEMQRAGVVVVNDVRDVD